MACIKTGIDSKTLRSYKNENVKPNIGKIMSVALVFHLPPELSNILIRIVGDYPNTTEGSYLFFIMNVKYYWPIGKINTYLENLGYKPLTEKIA